MSVVPCSKNEKIKQIIDEFAEELKIHAHTIGGHGLSEEDFYASGVFRGAIERIRGQFSATMRPKRDFVSSILNHMQDRGYIKEWISAGGKNRHDYTITLFDGKTSVVELKGCMDGNNTNIFDRPPHADEFVVWSVCTNDSADPRKNAWSGLHTRLSSEMISNNVRIDGLIVWDWVCGTTARPCPKLKDRPERRTEVGPYLLAPPCLFLFPSTVPSPRNNPNPKPQNINNVGFIYALSECFGCNPLEINDVSISVAYEGSETVRTTKVARGGIKVQESKPTPIRRT